MRFLRAFFPYIPALRVVSVVLIAMLFIGLAPDAWASQQSQGEGGNCPGNGFLERIVPCITKAIEQSTTKLTMSLSSYLFPATSVFVVLVIILYGAKVMSPEGSPRRTAIPLLLKIAFVLFFAQGFGGFIPAVHGGLKDVVDILANALDISSQCQSEGGSGGGGGGGGAAAMGSDKIWTQMDCMLGKLYGFTGKDGNTMLIASMFGLMAGFLFGGSFGLIAFFAIFGLLWGVLIFVFRAAFAFLNGFMLASFAVVISPIFIPLLLLQVPSQYYQKWTQLLMSAFIMPLLVVGYCIFALSIYNKMLFESERGKTLRKTMDKAFTESITGMRTECLGSILNNVFFIVKGGTGGSGGSGSGSGSGGGSGSRDGNTVLNSGSVPNPAIPQQSGGQGLCIKIPNIDLQKLTDGFKNKQDFFRKIFTEGVGIFLLAWLLLQGLKLIEESARMLAGSAAGALLTPLTDTEKRLQSAMDNAKQNMQQSMMNPDGSSVSGTEFIRRIPGSISALGSGFIRGVQ